MNLVADSSDDSRGVSPVVAVVLLFGLVLFGATLVAVTGMSLLDTMQTESSLDRAETSMQQVSADLGELSDSPDERRTELNLGDFEEGETAVVSDGTMTFDINPDRTPAGKCEDSIDIGTLEYERDGSTVGFQAGGVWRSDGESATLVSQPDLTYDAIERDGETIYTVNFPATNVNPDASSLPEGTVEAHHNRTLSKQRQAEIQDNLCLPADEHGEINRIHNIELRIEDNQYDDAWERYLRGELGDVGEVTRSGNAVVATAPLGPIVDMNSPDDYTVGDTVTDAAVRSTAAQRIHLKNDVEVDSYDSSRGSYDDTESSDGKFVTAGSVKMNNAVIHGNLTSNENVTIRGGRGSVNGHISYADTLDAPPGTYDSASQDADVDTDLTPMDPRIEYYLSELKRNNDNDATGAIDGETIDGGSGDELASGVYYVDSFEVTDDLTINTSEGDVVIGVADDVEIDAALSIEGSGDVRFFVNDSLTVGENGDVTVEGRGNGNRERSTGNWMFCREDCDVDIEKSARFVGVVYAPSPSASSSITVDSSNGRQTEVFGSLVGGETTISSTGAKFHYDTHVANYGDPTIGESNSETGGGEVTIKNLESFDVRTTLLGTELSGTSGPYHVNGPVSIELRFDQPGEPQQVHQPWPETEPSGAGWDDDVNFPTTSDTHTAEYEDLEANTSFTAYASSRHSGCSDSAYTGQIQIDGDWYYEYGCGSDDPPEIEINTDSDSDESNIAVLEDGDEVPDVNAAGKGQRSIRDMLGDKVNGTNHLQLDDNEFVFLFELSHDDPPSSEYDTLLEQAKNEDGDPDFNDAVLLYEVTDAEYNETTREVDDGTSTSPIPDDDYSYTVNIENNQIVIGSD